MRASASTPSASSKTTPSPESNAWRKDGGFILLEPLQQADRIYLIDATADENPYGTVTRTTPKFAKDYPPTLTAHDIGVKDLLDAFYIQGGDREVILYAISIDPKQAISMELSEQCVRPATKLSTELWLN